MKLIVIYDDTGRKSEVITDIIGRKGFADVVVNRTSSGGRSMSPSSMRTWSRNCRT